MKINDILKNNNVKMSNTLSEMLVFAIKEIYPLLYERFHSKNCNDYVIAYYVCEMDLPEEDAKKIILKSSRVSKIWAFS